MVKGERGQALIAALVALLLIGVAGALVAASLGVRQRLARREVTAIRLGAMVDAALAEALADLSDAPGSRGETPHPFADGELASRIEETGELRRRVWAGARLGVTDRWATADVLLTPSGPHVLAWRYAAPPFPPPWAP